jgi:hypothetical protein
VSEELNIKDEEQPKLHFEVFSQIEEFMHHKLPMVFSKAAPKKSREKPSISPLPKPMTMSTSSILRQSGELSPKEKGKKKSKPKLEK